MEYVHDASAQRTSKNAKNRIKCFFYPLRQSHLKEHLHSQFRFYISFFISNYLQGKGGRLEMLFFFLFFSDSCDTVSREGGYIREERLFDAQALPGVRHRSNP